MNDRQTALILEIIREQLDDYLVEDLAEVVFAGIAEGINDNLPLLEDMAG